MKSKVQKIWDAAILVGFMKYSVEVASDDMIY
jgi:hypothetical protein